MLYRIKNYIILRKNEVKTSWVLFSSCYEISCSIGWKFFWNFKNFLHPRKPRLPLKKSRHDLLNESATDFMFSLLHPLCIELRNIIAYSGHNYDSGKLELILKTIQMILNQVLIISEKEAENSTQRVKVILVMFLFFFILGKYLDRTNWKNKIY